MNREEAIEVLQKNYPDSCYSMLREALDMAIEALKTQDGVYCTMASRPCFAQGKEIAWCLTCPHISKEDRGLVKKAIECVQKWIPCSKGLPENTRPVIVTWKNNDPESYYQYIVGKHFIGTAHYHKGKWYWYSSVTEDLLAEYGKCETEEFDEAIEVVAWMPLPEPYKVESEDKE